MGSILIDPLFDLKPSLSKHITGGDFREKLFVLNADNLVFTSQIGSQRNNVVLELEFSLGGPSQALFEIVNLLFKLDDLVLLLVEQVGVV